jgi:hypothetical protein
MVDGIPSFILTSFAYGTGPYLRTTEWALAVADLLQQKHQIIVPLVYGEKQRSIMREALGLRMNEIILDETYGKLLAPLFYGKETYATYLERWVSTVDVQSQLIKKHLETTYGKNIVVELHRSPRFAIGIAPAYALTFGWQSDILAQAKGNPDMAIPETLLEQAICKFQQIESSFPTTFTTDPGTFSHMSSFQSSMLNAQCVPPTIPPPHPSTRSHAPGIYVTVTGIPGLERLFDDALRLGMTIYTNDPKAIPGSKMALPDVIGNPAIRLHFARSGWSSVWLSMLTETPFVAAPWDPYDDPEIYFNNQCVETLGIGTVYRGQSLHALLAECEEQKGAMRQMKEVLQKKYGSLDGTNMAAEKITASIT